MDKLTEAMSQKKPEDQLRALDALVVESTLASRNADYAAKAGFTSVRDSSGGVQFLHEEK